MRNLLIAGSCMCCVMVLGAVEVFAQKKEIDLRNCYENNAHTDPSGVLELQWEEEPGFQKIKLKSVRFKDLDNDALEKQHFIIKVPGSINNKQVEVGRETFANLMRT